MTLEDIGISGASSSLGQVPLRITLLVSSVLTPQRSITVMALPDTEE